MIRARIFFGIFIFLINFNECWILRIIFKLKALTPNPKIRSQALALGFRGGGGVTLNPKP